MEKSMLDYLRIPKVNRIVFERTPLVLAVFQVRFSPILSISDPVAVAPFQRALSARYPILNSWGDVQAEGVPSNPQIENRPAKNRWKFSDYDDTWTVSLALESITIETREYQEFEDFLDRLAEVLVAFTESFPQPIGTRIGLRYINEVRAAQGSWEEVIQSELLGPLSYRPIAEHIDQAIQQMVLKFEGDQGINFRHGYLEGTVIPPRPGQEPPSSRFYLLDFDAYREYRRPGSLLFDPEVICKQVGIYHEAVSRLFRWSITEEYTASLGVRRNAADE